MGKGFFPGKGHKRFDGFHLVTIGGNLLSRVNLYGQGGISRRDGSRRSSFWHHNIGGWSCVRNYGPDRLLVLDFLLDQRRQWSWCSFLKGISCRPSHEGLYDWTRQVMKKKKGVTRSHHHTHHSSDHARSLTVFLFQVGPGLSGIALVVFGLKKCRHGYVQCVLGVQALLVLCVFA